MSAAPVQLLPDGEQLTLEPLAPRVADDPAGAIDLPA